MYGSNHISNPKKLQAKSRTHNVTPLDHNTFDVKSGSSGKLYTAIWKTIATGRQAPGYLRKMLIANIDQSWKLAMG